MEINHRDIMLSFWQQGTSNCASIALIKAAIEVFGIHNVFEQSSPGDTYHITLKNGRNVSFTTAELEESARVANFQESKDLTPSKQEVYQELLEYGKLCYAVMVATYAAIEIKDDTSPFLTALHRLNNGANSNFIDRYLGLEEFVSNGRGNPRGDGMYAWFRRHTVYVSHGEYDFYGNIRKYRWTRYPKRMKVNETKQPITKGNSQLPEYSPKNFINVNKFGTFQKTGDDHTSPEQVDEILHHIKESGKKNLLIYFHGGLVDEQMGMDGAELFFEKYSENPDTHVLSLVWETGLIETIPQTLSQVLTDNLALKLLHKVGRFLGIKLGVVNPNLKFSKKEGPESFVHYARLFENMEVTDESLSIDFAEQPYREGEVTVEYIHQDMQTFVEDEELSEEDLERLEYIEMKKGMFPGVKILFFAARIAYRCIRRFSKKRDHGIWPTIVEEVLREINLDDLGSGVWDTMKLQAKNMWLSNQGRSGMNQFAGRYLFEKIQEVFPENELQIDLVGHSAGSIAICEWIKAMNEESVRQPIVFRSATFLAPACRCKLFNETVLKYPGSIKHFRMFTLSDTYESTDVLVPILYPRSLLYLISGLLEADDSDRGEAYLLGLQRHISALSPYDNEKVLKEVNRYLFPDNDSRVVYSVSSNGDGRSADAESHKNFTFSTGVVNSIKYFIRGLSDQVILDTAIEPLADVSSTEDAGRLTIT